ncbi:U3 small nucleolar RNA-associated protein [Coemansia erecta]|nr:U3 small nucleolar RNA-associated protein [Coemansia erecta]KAJ2888094.1 U3 small nucleolar RNA-associated protein [Coemansia asiatica]
MQIHRCRFADYIPKAVNAIECTPPTVYQQRLAVGRANGDIEIWGIYGGRLLYEKLIPGIVNGSLEALAWTHQTKLTAEDLELFDTKVERDAAKKRLVEQPPRLFSAGLNSVIVEWDIAKLVPKAAVDSYGGAVWCMAPNHAQTQLAVGTEDGHIRIFDITDGKLTYQRCFNKIKSRILSVAWSHDDETIVTGSADSCVRVWTASTGLIASRMTLPKEGKLPTLVWAVKVLENRTIVSGDSRGHVVFWDPVMHVAQQDFRAQGADVLCLAASEGGNTVFASGVDPKVTQFKLFSGSKPVDSLTDRGMGLKKKQKEKKSDKSVNGMGPATKWQLTGFRRYHTHDVRALCVSSEKPWPLLVTGGVDTQVTACAATDFPNEHPLRQPCFPPSDTVISVAPKAKTVLQHQETTLKLWELGKAEPVSESLGSKMESGQGLQIYERQKDLLRMEVTTKTHILSSAISSSGNLVAVSDSAGPKLYCIMRASDDNSVVRAHRLRSFPPANFVPEYSENRGVTGFRFTSDEKRVVMTTADGFVSIVDVSEWRANKFVTVRRHCGHRTSKDQVEADAGCDDVATSPGKIKKAHPADAGMCTIVKMAVSHSDKFVATGDCSGLIVVSEMDGMHNSVVTLPRPHGRKEQLTSLAFDRSDNLVITTVLNHVYVWDVAKSALTEWSAKHSCTGIPMPFERNMDFVMGVVTNAAEPSVVYTWATNHITRIDLAMGPGPKRSVLNIHKRKHIETEILKEVHEEKEQADRRFEQLTIKRKKRESISAPPVDGDARDSAMEVESEAGGASMEELAAEKDWSLNNDWSLTYVARLREAGINFDEPHNFRMTQRYQSLMHASFIDDNTMVVIERPWIDVASMLPLAYNRHRFVR